MGREANLFDSTSSAVSVCGHGDTDQYGSALDTESFAAGRIAWAALPVGRLAVLLQRVRVRVVHGPVARADLIPYRYVGELTVWRYGKGQEG